MRSMSTAALVSVEEYLRLTEKPNCEYEEGVVHPKAMPTFLHSWIQGALWTLLGKQGALALAELTVRLSPTQYLVPDVCVVQKIEQPYPTEPVLLCVEILSPKDRLGAMLAKCELYHAWGVPFCWVIHPETRIAWEYHLGGEPVRLDETGVLRAGELVVAMAELFSGLPQ